MRSAASRGAQVILLQELFEAPCVLHISAEASMLMRNIKLSSLLHCRYFCQLQRADFFALASPADVRMSPH